MAVIAPALGVFGFVLIILAMLMLAPALLALTGSAEQLNAFLSSAAICFTFGTALFIGFRQQMRSPTPKKMFLVTGLCWVGVSLAAALPLILSDIPMSMTDAVFEAVSGVTTTGSTVMTNLDNTAKDILLWRSLMQWIGGIGVIGMAVAILPFLRVGAMRLFQTESSDWSNKAVAKGHSQLRYILLIYVLLTAACMGYYYGFGMSLFDAVNHAMTTISTGGYSTSDSSIGLFQDPRIQWGSVLFMALGGLPFTLFIHVFILGQASALKDSQLQTYFIVLITAGLGMAGYLMLTQNVSGPTALTLAFVNTTSVITTTGYASDDYGAWGNGAQMIFLLLMMLGGCSGSTSGGTKIFRLQLLFSFLSVQLLRAIHPRSVAIIKFNGQRVTDDVVSSLVAFLGMAALTTVVIGIGLGLTGLDFTTSISSALTAVMNVGPGLGDTVGPAGNFSSLSDSAKWLLCVGMLAGRLEFLTLFVLLAPSFWRW